MNHNLASQTIYECEGCSKESAIPNRCDFCEMHHCDRCFRAHDCGGHDPEIVFCAGCRAECEVSQGKLGGHETRPALIDGEPVCAKCAYFKPWEIKPLSHFEKAG
jgi:hypothetical protein